MGRVLGEVINTDDPSDSMKSIMRVVELPHQPIFRNNAIRISIRKPALCQLIIEGRQRGASRSGSHLTYASLVDDDRFAVSCQQVSDKSRVTHLLRNQLLRQSRMSLQSEVVFQPEWEI